MDDSVVDALVREQILFTRFAVHNLAPQGREVVLERSALILIARLDAQGPMTVAELAEAFELDISTIHRQTTAAVNGGLLERIADPAGGIARKLRPTQEGLRRFHTELSARRTSVRMIMTDWSDEEVERFSRDLRRYNEAIERVRGGGRWPREQ